jgi:uracil-DNA glycosylase
MTPILLLAEARGEAEARHSSTLVGASGVELLRQLHQAEILHLSPIDEDLIGAYYATTNSRHLMDVWANHPEVHRTNVFNIHPPGNDLNYFLGPKPTAIPGLPSLKITKSSRKNAASPGGSFVQAPFATELERLSDEILAHDPNLIICLGNCALWAMAGITGVTKLRGTTLTSTHCVSGYKLLPTYHPAAVLRNYDLRPVVIADLAKAHRESEFPDVRRPHREIWIEPTLEDIAVFIEQYTSRCALLSVDIETAGDRITCIGFAPDPTIALVVPFDDPRTASGCYWETKVLEHNAWGLIRRVLEDPTIPKLFQNGAYDIVFLWRSMKIKVLGATEDTMLLHHALHPEALKSLGFLGSIYSSEQSWKDMRKAKTTKRDD